ncbi:DUF3090 family protein [Nostocoides sp. F2B08]|uniref:DUF3090 family protein n=1 Tax=Nostocoides sp. F2B08 TaxID=2653936 RepID=UPI001262EFC9|nr:DUF3090 family protein [Tetrasphaera sp. F2B08]KAB7742957.1 DUF3090 family protein [Tetrasphaera sp. F2B08]
MPTIDFDPPTRCVVGTVGPPGERTFFVQVRAEGRSAAVSIEKFHVTTLADRINDVLDRVAGASASETAAALVADNDPLEAPIEEDFRVTTVRLLWDAERGAVVVELYDEDPDEAEAAQGIRVWLSPQHARAFARRALAVAAAGRPPCPFCGGPLEASGHICPRANGYRRQ